MDRAETYLRLLAEREIRHGGIAELRNAATLLTDAGAVTDGAAAAIVEWADQALALRSGQPHASGFSLLHRLHEAEPAAGPWQVIPAGHTMAGRTGTIGVPAAVRTAQGLYVVAMRKTGEPVQLEDVIALSATDDAGRGYSFTLAAPVLLELDPAPPEQVTQLTIYENATARMRLDLRAMPAAARSTPVPESVAERVLIRRAEALLAAVSDGLSPRPRFGEAVRVLTGAGLLDADSIVPAQLAALASQLSLPAAGLPTPAELPPPWRSVLTQLARLRQPPAQQDAPVTQLAMPLPGMRGVITGVSRSRLYLVAHELAAHRSPWRTANWSHGPRPALPAAPEVPLSAWAHDEGGHWHVVATEDFRVRSSGLVAAALSWQPPLGKDVTRVSVTVADQTAQASFDVTVADS